MNTHLPDDSNEKDPFLFRIIACGKALKARIAASARVAKRGESPLAGVFVKWYLLPNITIWLGVVGLQWLAYGPHARPLSAWIEVFYAGCIVGFVYSLWSGWLVWKNRENTESELLERVAVTVMLVWLFGLVWSGFTNWVYVIEL